MEQYPIKSVTFGGFDKQDVVRYLEQASEKAAAVQRELEAENETLRKEAADRAEELDQLRAQVEELAGGDVIARPHFAQVMVRRGYVQTTREAFDRYLDTDEYQRIERQKPDARTCIEIIKAAGGLVSLAHPYQVKLEDDKLEALVKELAALDKLKGPALAKQRYDMFRAMGQDLPLAREEEP